MSYTITLPNGNLLGNIADGTGNGPLFSGSTPFSSLNLIGRNYSNYGQFIANDLVALLVNSASPATNPPTPALQGQLWYDSTNNILKVYTGTSFIPVGIAFSNASAPSTTVAGSFWWDSVNQQLYVYNGTSPYSSSGWILVGPQRNGSGALWEQIYDTGNVPHDVVSIYLDGIRTAIISTTTFTPNVSITGFTTIQSGYTMNSGYTIYGTANNASYLGLQPAANYMRTDINNTVYGSLTMLSNAGVTMGTSGSFVANVSSVGTGRLYNTYAGGNVSIHVNSTLNGQEKSFWVSGYDGYTYVSADPIGNLGVVTKQYVDNSFANSPVLGGAPTAPTAGAGTANTQIATTAFVVNNSGFFTNKIYQGNSYLQILDTGAGNLTLSIDNVSVMTATVSGVNLLGDPTTPTVSQTYNDNGSGNVASTQYVKTATQWWGGSAKFVSNVAPVLGVNDTGSNNGDFWFQISS